MYAGEMEMRLQKLVASTGYTREKVLRKLADGDLVVADEGPIPSMSREEADAVLAKAQSRLERGKKIKPRLLAKIQAIAEQYPEVRKSLSGSVVGDGRVHVEPKFYRESRTGLLRKA